MPQRNRDVEELNNRSSIIVRKERTSIIPPPADLRKFLKHVDSFRQPSKDSVTFKRGITNKDDLILLNSALGLAGETGEVVDHVKKAVFHGKPLDMDAVALELGDTYWYLVAFTLTLGLDPVDIFGGNIQKLEARHGGKVVNFSVANKNKGEEHNGYLPVDEGRYQKSARQERLARVGTGERYAYGHYQSGRRTTIYKATTAFRCALSGKPILPGDLFTRGAYPNSGSSSATHPFHQDVIPFTVDTVIGE